jgi:hypothetical protein
MMQTNYQTVITSYIILVEYGIYPCMEGKILPLLHRLRLKR